MIIFVFFLLHLGADHHEIQHHEHQHQGQHGSEAAEHVGAPGGSWCGLGKGFRNEHVNSFVGWRETPWAKPLDCTVTPLDDLA